MRKNVIICLFSITFIWLLIVSSIAISNNNNDSNGTNVEEVRVTGFSTDFSEVIKNTKSSMVAVEQNGKVSSGFIYKKKDDLVYVATSFHGISESENANVTFNNGVKVNGKVYGSDLFADVALLECDFPFDVQELKFGDSTLLKDGEFVLSIGTNNSMDYAFSNKFGMVSKNYQEIKNQISFNEENYEYYLGLIQLSGDFTNGYSGAPVLNMNGELVGSILMKDDDITFALTGDELKKVLDCLYNNLSYRRVNFGFKGKYIKDLENYEVNSLNINVDLSEGYYVSEVLPFSFASKIGILKADVITKINDVKLVDSNSLLSLMYSEELNFTFEIIRNGEKIKLQGVIDA